MAYMSGKSGKVSAGGTDLDVKGWSFDPNCDLQDTSNSGDSGYKTFIAGLLGGTGSIEMDWDAAANPTTNPPNLNPGEEITNMDLYLDSVNYIRIPTALISGTPVANAVDGKVTFNCNFTASGSWTMAAGNWVPSY